MDTGFTIIIEIPGEEKTETRFPIQENRNEIIS